MNGWFRGTTISGNLHGFSCFILREKGIFRGSSVAMCEITKGQPVVCGISAVYWNPSIWSNFTCPLVLWGLPSPKHWHSCLDHPENCQCLVGHWVSYDGYHMVILYGIILSCSMAPNYLVTKQLLLEIARAIKNTTVSAICYRVFIRIEPCSIIHLDLLKGPQKTCITFPIDSPSRFPIHPIDFCRASISYSIIFGISKNHINKYQKNISGTYNNHLE